MKQKALGMLIGVLILSACGQVPATPALQNTSIPTATFTPNPTETLTPTETHTPTPEPTLTPTPLFDSEKMNIVHAESVHDGGDILVEGVRIKDLVLATDASVNGDSLTFDPELGRDASGNLTLLENFSMNETRVAREQVTKAVFYALYEAWKSPENVTPEDLALTKNKFGMNRQNVTFTQWMAALKAYQNKETYNGIGVTLEDIQVRIFAYDYGVEDQRYFYFDPTGPVRFVWTKNLYQLSKYDKGEYLFGIGTFHRADDSLGFVFTSPSVISARDDILSGIFIKLLKRISISSELQKVDAKSQFDVSKIHGVFSDPLVKFSCYNHQNVAFLCGIAPASENGR